MTALERYEKWIEDWRAAKESYPLRVPRRRADAAIESLKVCGNCEHLCWDIDGWCATEETLVKATVASVWFRDKCHFTPSRWQERKT